MKTKILLGTFACAALLVSCSDQMDYREDTGGKYDKDAMEQAFSYVSNLVTNVYTYLDYDYGNYGGAMAASATDESDYSVPGTSIETFFNGSWSATNAQSSVWTDSYKAISDANNYLTDFSEGLKFPEHELDDEYKDQMEQYVNYFPYEIRFLRAYYYFNLVRQYGAVPLITEKIDKSQVNSLERTPAKDVFEFIDKECSEIAGHLPLQWSQASSAAAASEQLRASRLAVLALRARAALYHASPLFNPENDQNLWREAAIKNKAVIDACLEEGFKLADYSATWGKGNAAIAPGNEMIMVRPIGTQNKTVRLEQRNFPVGINGAGAGGNCPTQTLVEAYETKNGELVDWSDEAAATARLSQLDPRFAKTIAVNGELKWPFYNTTPLETYYNGVNGQPTLGGTTTGYYLKKLMGTTVDLRTNKNVGERHCWVIFRLGEFYLNYAEAVYKMTGSATAVPTGSEFASGYNVSALDALNVTRTRGGVSALTEAQASERGFWNCYERERMVELCFEGHRFWDVRRWKEGDKFSGKNIYVMNITKNDDGSFSYKRTNLESERGDWQDKMYLFPIPSSEMLIHEKYGTPWQQNDGWE